MKTNHRLNNNICRDVLPIKALSEEACVLIRYCKLFMNKQVSMLPDVLRSG